MRSSRCAGRRVVSSCRALGAELIVKAVLGGCAFGLFMSLPCAPASARYRHVPPRQDKETERASKDPFGNIPKGPLQIYVSIDQQKLHLYSDGVHVADTSVATGVPSLPTPLGVFSVIQRQRYHESNIYSKAPMPFMQRITWSGVALHEGENIGHRASHGCIRMPHDFAVRLYSLGSLGVPVVVADAELKPIEIADPHLFVHKDRPPPSPPPAIAVTPPPASVQTAQSAPAAPAIVVTSPPTLVQTAQSAPAAPAIVVTSPPTLVQTAQSAPAASAIVITPPPASVQTALSASAALADDSGKTTDAAATDPSTPPKPDQIGLRVDAAALDGAPAATPADAVPAPVKPADTLPDPPAKKTPIAILISRKEKKIYVRQGFQ